VRAQILKSIDKKIKILNYFYKKIAFNKKRKKKNENKN